MACSELLVLASVAIKLRRTSISFPGLKYGMTFSATVQLFRYEDLGRSEHVEPERRMR